MERINWFWLVVLIGAVLCVNGVSAWSNNTLNYVSYSYTNMTKIQASGYPAGAEGHGSGNFAFLSYDNDFSSFSELTSGYGIYLYNFSRPLQNKKVDLEFKYRFYSAMGGYINHSCYTGSSWQYLDQVINMSGDEIYKNISIPDSCLYSSVIQIKADLYAEGEGVDYYENQLHFYNYLPLSTENLTFIGNENLTRYLVVPQYRTLANGYLNLSGIMIENYKLDHFICGSSYTQRALYNISSSSWLTRIVQNRTVNNNRINKFGMTIYHYAGSNNGELYYRIRNISDAIIDEVYIGNTSVLPDTSCSSSPFMANFSIKPLLNGQYYIGIEIENLTDSSVRIGASGDYINSLYSDLLYEDPGVYNSDFGPGGANRIGYNITFNRTEFPENSYSNIGSSQVWNYSGQFNQTNNRTSNLAPFINTYLGTCSYVSGYCNVPFLFHSDTAGILQYSDMNFNNLGFLENSQTYNTTTYETSSEGFILNLTYDISYYTLASANLIYDGTTYTGTKSGTGDTITFSTSLVTPLVSASTNKTFYWAVSLYNGTVTEYYNSSFKNQTVNPLPSISIGTSCSAGLQRAFYFDIKDEVLLSLMLSNLTYNVQYGLGGNSIGKIANGNISNVNNFSICINSSLPTYTVGYGEIQYNAEGYAPRRFYIFDGTRATNSTINNTLYLLSTTLSSAFLVTVQDNQYNPQTNAYLSLLRWYPDLNAYKIVEMAKTDDKGQTVLNVKTESVDYRVGVYTTGGTLLKLFDPIRFVCTTAPCQYSVFIPVAIVTVTDVWNIQSSLTFNKTSKIFTYIWNDPSQTSQTMNLTVYRDSYGTTSIICSTTASSFTGLISCDVSAYTGNVRAVVYRSASPTIPIEWLNVNLNQLISSIAGGKTFALFMGFILLTFTFLAGLFNPVIAMILGIISLIPVFYFGGISTTVFIGLILLTGLIIHFMRRS